MYYTTLNRIKSHNLCQNGWKTLLSSLDKKKADDAPLSLKHILDSNGINDAIWALRCIDTCPEIRLFAVRCVWQIQHLLKSPQAVYALYIAEQYAIGGVRKEELNFAAAYAAAAAADAAAYAAAADAAAYAAAYAAAADAAAYAARAEQREDFISIFCAE